MQGLQGGHTLRGWSTCTGAHAAREAHLCALEILEHDESKAAALAGLLLSRHGCVLQLPVRRKHSLLAGWEEGALDMHRCEGASKRTHARTRRESLFVCQERLRTMKRRSSLSAEVPAGPGGAELGCPCMEALGMPNGGGPGMGMNGPPIIIG